MARVELPESRLKARKRRRLVRIGIFSCVLLVLLFGALVGVSYIPALQVRAITISGAQTLSSSTIEAFVRDRLMGNYWYVFPKSNIFLYPKQRIAADIMRAYPALASADVHADDFESIAVIVVERSPRALWCTSAEDPSARCYFMDENGTVYAEAPVFSAPVYTPYAGALADGSISLGLPRRYLTPERFQALSALVDAVAQKVSESPVAAVDVDANSDVALRFVNNFTLRFALPDPGGDIFERFSLALTSEPMKSHKLADFEYLDLRFGDKLYYKLR